MEKYCPKCGKVYKGKDAKAKVCMFCAIPLNERESRIPFSEDIRDKVFKRDGYRCVRCGASNKEKRLEVDHIIPISRGGTNDIGNLQTLCWECNKDKGSVVPDLGLKYDIEIKENELKTLNRLIKENKNKLNAATNENDRIEYAFNIKQLEKDISPVSEELNELKIKHQEEQDRIKIEKEENERKEFLFKKLSVKLSPIEILILKEHFDLNSLTDEAMFKTISYEYTEEEIFQVIEEYNTELHKFLNDSIKFNMLPLISSKLSLNNSSKKYIINYLSDNYTKSQINDLLESINNELFIQYNLSFNDIEKSLLKRYYSLNDSSNNELINYIIKNDFSIDELKNTVDIAYNETFQEFYNKLNENQKKFVMSEFKNPKKDFVNFLINNNFSLKELNIKIFNQYNLSFTSIEKTLLKRHYSLNNASDNDLINYVIKNNFSIDELKNTLDIAYNETFQEFYNKLNENQRELVKFRFKNSKKNLVDFLVNNYFSFKELTDELDKTKLDLFDKSFNSLNTNEQSLIQRYSKVYSPNFDLINYFYKNKFSDEKIGELVEISKKYLITEVHNNLNDNEIFLLENTFEEDNSLTQFMVDNQYSFKSLRKELNKTEKTIRNDLSNLLSEKHEFLLKKYFSISDDSSLINYLISHNYTVSESLEIADRYKKELYKIFDNNLNHQYKQILYEKFSLNVNSKELIDYLIFEGYTVDSMKSLIRNDVYNEYSNALDSKSISLLYYKFKFTNSTEISPSYIKDYLFENNHDVYWSIKEAKTELNHELDNKLDHRAVNLLNKELKLQKSKDDLIFYLIENYTAENIKKLLEKYHVYI